jgi:antitoxin FitA
MEMTAVLVRNLSEATHRAIKRRAKAHGISTEAEIRNTLDASVAPEEKMGFGDKLAEIGRKLGGVELDIPPRTGETEPAEFE